MSATRRVYQYLATLIALGVFAVGTGQLLSLLFDILFVRTSTRIGTERFSLQQLSLGLAMVVITSPIWFFFWRSIQRRVVGNTEEIGAAMRKLFLNFILVVTTIVIIVNGSDLLRWLISGPRWAGLPSGTLATLVVTVIIWIYHYRTSETEGHPSPAARTLRRWYVYFLGAFGLVWLAEALIQFINTLVLLLPLWQDILVKADFWNYSTRTAVTHIVFGGLVWYFHWFRLARGDIDSILRQVYFYLFAIFEGAIAALVGLIITLMDVFSWMLGGVRISTSQHFKFLGWAIPLMLVGAGIWMYHQRRTREEESRVTESHRSAERINLYLMAFVGLGTTAAGLIILFGILLNLALGTTGTSITTGTGWWQSQVGLCLALLVVGVPLWWYYWGKVLKRVATGGIEEWRATSRRIFLYAVAGIAIGALIADLVNIVYQILNGILQGSTGNILRESRWSIQTFIVAAPFLWYFWGITRTDQKRGVEVLAARKTVTLLTSDSSGALAKQIAERLGYRLHTLIRAGAAEEPSTLNDEELARVTQEIGSAPAPRVMLVAIAGKIMVLPYREK